MSEVTPYAPTPATGEFQKVDVAKIRQFLSGATQETKLFDTTLFLEVAPMMSELVDLVVEDGLLERVEQARMHQTLDDVR